MNETLLILVYCNSSDLNVVTSKIIEPGIVILKAFFFFGHICEVDNLHCFLNHGESIREGVTIYYVHKYHACYSLVLWIDLLPFKMLSPQGSQMQIALHAYRCKKIRSQFKTARVFNVPRFTF